MRGALQLSIVLALAFFGSTGCALAAAPQIVPVIDRALALVPSSRCGGTLVTIAELPATCFVPARTLRANGTATVWNPLTQWFRFGLPEASDTQPRTLVVSTYVTAGELAAIAPGGAVIGDARFGSEVPVANRPVRSHDIRVPLPPRMPPGTQIVVRVMSPYSIVDPFQVQTTASLDELDRQQLIDQGLPFAFLNGGALTMALFNLVLFVMLRRSIYGVYAAAITALVFYQVVETGAAWTLLWPSLGLRDDYPSYVAWVLYVGLIVTFTRRILNLRRVSPLLDRVLSLAYVAVIVDSIAYVVIPDVLVKWGLFDWIDPLVTAVMVGTILVAGVVAWRRAVSGAPAFVIAFAGSAIGIVIADIAFYTPALAAYPALAYLPTSYGFAWESVFLALALGQRVRDVERDAERLSEYAFRDGLTGIANRRAFDDAIAEEWLRMQRIGANVAIVLFDIDHFKAFNDRYGHQAGDERLIAVARAIGQAARRKGDVAARYGGEEFALLLPNTTLENAFAIADTVRQRVAAESADVELTISAGVAVAVASLDPGDSRALLASADAALYAAKKSGRDRTSRWNTLIGAGSTTAST